MKRLLKVMLSLAATVAIGSCAFTAEKGEVDSSIKAFLEYGLRAQAEAYLVCVWQVDRTLGDGNGADIQATVLESIKGPKQIGDKFRFQRISDSGVWDFAPLRGGLYYVFLKRGNDGQVSVDVQDPGAVWKYSDELRGVVEHYRRRG